MRWITYVVMSGCFAAAGDRLHAADWTQFRGPNATGVATESGKLPDRIGPNENLLWKTPIPRGISSPIVTGNRVFVTAAKGEALVTIAIDARSGKVLWEKEAPHQGLEQVHQTGSHAQSTPVTDGEVVVSFFGSAGLFCYDLDGKLLWSKPMGPFKNSFGAGSSPIIVDDWIILNQDHDTDSFLMAIDKRTGQQVWRTDRSEFPRNYATPVIWENEGKKQIVIAATLRVIGYDLKTGKEAWTVNGIARIVNMTPTVGSDGILYVPAWSPGADENDRIQVGPFAETIGKHDANNNKAFDESEVPDGPLKQRFDQIDRDKDGKITELEYESMRKVFEAARNVFIAVKPGGTGDITDSHVLWSQSKFLPYVPSPVYYKGNVFMVKNAGILTCLDAKTGQVAKQGRISGRGNYFSSPVIGDGKVYLISQHGELSVVSAEAQWEELSSAEFGEGAMATPAIAGGKLFLRTDAHLYCFGIKQD